VTVVDRLIKVFSTKRTGGNFEKSPTNMAPLFIHSIAFDFSGNLDLGGNNERQAIFMPLEFDATGWWHGLPRTYMFVL
jgi:hypothetical protein